MAKQKSLDQFNDDVNEGDVISFRLKIGEDYVGVCSRKYRRGSCILNHFPSGKSHDNFYLAQKLIIEKDDKGRRVESYEILRRAKK